MASERSAADIRSLANRFRGMLNDREAQALSNIRPIETKAIGAPTPTPVVGVKLTPADVAERYRHLGEKNTVARQPGTPVRPTPTPEAPSQRREGPSR